MNPLADITGKTITSSLEYTLSELRMALRVPKNSDIVIRRIMTAGFPSALVYIDGMIHVMIIDDHVIAPAMNAAPYEGEASERAMWLMSSVITSSSTAIVENLDEAVTAILQGNSVLFIDGCQRAVLVDAKGIPKRNVDRPVNETTVIGPHEGFVESMRSNIALIRRIVQSPRLVVERHMIGTGIKTACSLVYLDGVANEQILAEVRRRLAGINIDFIISSGELEQLIEDSPHALIPQFAHTERPDRTATFLVSGQVVLMVEGSPVVLAMPAVVMHMVHTSEESSLRFPYGSFKRIIEVIGIIITVLLPSLYLSVLMYHNELLPLSLLSSIYESQTRVPIPLLYEFIFLSLAFDLINAASAHMPSVLTHGLGVVSALILGQAVISADLVSPLMIIVVAIASLGPLLLSEYELSLGIRMVQLAFVAAASIGGLFGVLLMSIMAFVEMCSMTSMGVPMMGITAPQRMHNLETIGKYPIWQQRIRHYLANPEQLLRAQGRVRTWDRKEKRNGK